MFTGKAFDDDKLVSSSSFGGLSVLKATDEEKQVSILLSLRGGQSVGWMALDEDSLISLSLLGGPSSGNDTNINKLVMLSSPCGPPGGGKVLYEDKINIVVVVFRIPCREDYRCR